jgi:hypothetical protein
VPFGERGIGEQVAVGEDVGDQLRREALMRVVLEEGRAADRVEEQIVGEVVLGRQRLHRDRARAVLGDDRVQPRGDVVERLVPGDAAPAAGAARAVAPQRIKQALRREGHVRRGLAFRTEVAAAQWVPAVAFHVHAGGGAAACLDQHFAAHEAKPAGGANCAGGVRHYGLLGHDRKNGDSHHFSSPAHDIPFRRRGP